MLLWFFALATISRLNPSWPTIRNSHIHSPRLAGNAANAPVAVASFAANSLSWVDPAKKNSYHSGKPRLLVGARAQTHRDPTFWLQGPQGFPMGPCYGPFESGGVV